MQTEQNLMNHVLPTIKYFEYQEEPEAIIWACRNKSSILRICINKQFIEFLNFQRK